MSIHNCVPLVSTRVVDHQAAPLAHTAPTIVLTTRKALAVAVGTITLVQADIPNVTGAPRVTLATVTPLLCLHPPVNTLLVVLVAPLVALQVTTVLLRPTVPRGLVQTVLTRAAMLAPVLAYLTVTTEMVVHTPSVVLVNTLTAPLVARIAQLVSTVQPQLLPQLHAPLVSTTLVVLLPLNVPTAHWVTPALRPPSLAPPVPLVYTLTMDNPFVLNAHPVRDAQVVNNTIVAPTSTQLVTLAPALAPSKATRRTSRRSQLVKCAVRVTTLTLRPATTALCVHKDTTAPTLGPKPSVMTISCVTRAPSIKTLRAQTTLSAVPVTTTSVPLDSTCRVTDQVAVVAAAKTAQQAKPARTVPRVALPMLTLDITPSRVWVFNCCVQLATRAITATTP